MVSRRERMSTTLILEFGSHSLKLHYQSQTSGVFRKARFPWNLGHEVFTDGRISPDTAQKAVQTIQDLRDRGIHPRNLMAIATGALRDAENRDEFLKVVQDRLGLEVRVISGREEASLLALGYLKYSSKLPAMIADIGGGTLEIVYLGKDETILRDSLPLGAIRLHHLGSDGVGAWNEDLVRDWIERNFDEASVMTADEVHATGGTVKAIAKTLEKTSFSKSDLEEVEAKLRKEGPPSILKHDRAEVFLPGLLVMRKLLDHARAAKLTYIKVSVGRIFLDRFATRLPVGSDQQRKRFMLQHLRITSIHPRAPDQEGGKGP